jgi:Tol biopolymer transport system component
VETLEKEVLTSPLEGTLGDIHPETSPDGNYIVFCRSDSQTRGNFDIWMQSVEEGSSASRLTHLKFDSGGFPRWASDKKSVLFSTSVKNESSDP